MRENSGQIASSEGYKPPEDPMDDYRFYKCILHPLHTVCSVISTLDVRNKTSPGVLKDTGSDIPPSILMAVPRYIPEPMDTIWIRMNMFFMQKTTLR